MRMSETKNQGIPHVTEWGLPALAPQNKMKEKEKSNIWSMIYGKNTEVSLKRFPEDGCGKYRRMVRPEETEVKA